MAYRDELDAAYARIAALQDEIKELTDYKVIYEAQEEEEETEVPDNPSAEIQVIRGILSSDPKEWCTTETIFQRHSSRIDGPRELYLRKGVIHFAKKIYVRPGWWSAKIGKLVPEPGFSTYWQAGRSTIKTTRFTKQLKNFIKAVALMEFYE